MPSGNEQFYPAVSPIFGGGRVLPSPSQFFLTGEDRLRVVSVNSAAGVTVKVQLRTVPVGAPIQVQSFDHVPNTNRTIKTDDYPIGEGSLLNATVFASTGAPVSGQTFVIVQLVRGSGASGTVMGALVQGYVTSNQHLGFPGSPIISSTAGEPYVRNIIGTQPAAGAEIIETVPTGARWELVSFNAFLTKIGVAGGPMELRRFVGANPFWQALANHQQNAATVINYNFAQGWTNVAAGPPATGTSNQVLPANALFTSGDTIQTSLVNNAADQWSAPFMTVREWLEVP